MVKSHDKSTQLVFTVLGGLESMNDVQNNGELLSQTANRRQIEQAQNSMGLLKPPSPPHNTLLQQVHTTWSFPVPPTGDQVFSLWKSFSFKPPLKINILFWKILLEGLKLSKEPEGQDICCEILSSIYDKKVACMRSQRRKQLSKTYTMTIPVGMPRRTGKSHTVLYPNEGVNETPRPKSNEKKRVYLTYTSKSFFHYWRNSK